MGQWHQGTRDATSTRGGAMQDYWKHRYKHQWDASSTREEYIRALLCEITGYAVVYGDGLGAGSTDFISGSAAAHGRPRGAADLLVPSRGISVEVTGPHKPVPEDADLWVRPDKVAYAQETPALDHWIVVCSHDNRIRRVIHVDAMFCDACHRRTFPVVEPWIRGAQERFIAIPARSAWVRPFRTLADAIINPP